MTGLLVGTPAEAGDEDLQIQVDEPSLFGPSVNCNNLNMVLVAAENMEGKNYRIHYEIWRGKKWASQMSEISD